ncbi:MAG: flagellar export protein FliJ [Vulcanimicrobiaceae bacterium]
MGKFVFRLEPVLLARKRVEEQQQQVHAARRRELEAAQAELTRLDGEFRDHAQTLRHEHRSLTIDDLRLHYAHLGFLDRAIDLQMRVVSERRALTECARQELVQASKGRKVVEKLKEHRRELFRVEELRIEQRDLDDGDARRYVRSLHHVGGSL